MGIEALFEGQELSEDFKTKVAAVFEATVIEAVAENTKQLQEKHSADIAEQAEKFETFVAELSENYEEQIQQYIDTEIVESVDMFLNQIAQKWLEENKLAVQSGLRNEIAESFIDGMYKLFSEHYVEVPEAKVDLFDQISEQLDQTKDQLDKAIYENNEMKSFIAEQAKQEVISKVCEGLADTQKERLQTIAEGIEFVNIEQFEEKLNVVRNTMVVESQKPAQEKETSKPLTEGSTDMGALISELTRLAVKK